MDRDLVEQARRGDREAFGILARTYGDRLFGIARRILRDVELAEDAVQQALVIAWRELPRLRDPVDSRIRPNTTASRPRGPVPTASSPPSPESKNWLEYGTTGS